MKIASIFLAHTGRLNASTNKKYVICLCTINIDIASVSNYGVQQK
jgi:hypothetical protein